MWNWLKEILFGKKANEGPMLTEEKEVVNRKKLTFLEEVKLIFGEYDQPFTSGCNLDYQYITTEYADDEGIKELSIIGFHKEKNKILVIFKGVMRAGKFDMVKIKDILRTFKKSMYYADCEYNTSEYTLDVMAGFSRDLKVDDARQAEIVMSILHTMTADVRRVMPDIRRKYGR